MKSKRIFDLVFGAMLILVTLPITVLAAIGISLFSKGSIFYKAKRAGLHGKEFVMYKFRTMHVEGNERKSAITGANDPRIYGFGGILRKTKVDELPQLINVIKGEMSIVGPRPEDIDIVRKSYTKEYAAVLEVLPGLTSPSSIYYYTMCEDKIVSSDPEKEYIEKLLPVKLSLDVVYMKKQSFLYDIEIIVRTILVLLAIVSGKRKFEYPPELEEAKKLGLI